MADFLLRFSPAATARVRLERAGVAYTAEEFVKRAQLGDDEVVQWFLTAGMYPDARDSRGRTALDVATTGEGIDALVQAGASAGADEQCNQPIALLSALGSDELVRTLLARGCDVDNEAGFNSLWNAATQDHTSTIQLLLNSRADAKYLGPDEGGTPLTISIERANYEAAILLVPHSEVSSTDATGRDALSHAVETGRFPTRERDPAKRKLVLGLVSTLLDHGANVESADDSGRTPLFYAVGDAVVAKMLLDRGAMADVAIHDGVTPLMAAARIGAEETVSLLQAHGADVNRRDDLGWSAQMYSRCGPARSQGRQEVVATQGRDDVSVALWMAVDGGRAKAVAKYLQKGADPNLGDACL